MFMCIPLQSNPENYASQAAGTLSVLALLIGCGGDAQRSLCALMHFLQRWIGALPYVGSESLVRNRADIALVCLRTYGCCFELKGA
jgi:hypothetical protein